MNDLLRPRLDHLLDGGNLTQFEAQELLVALTDPELAPALAGALLAALRAKHLTADELRGFAEGMRSLARRPQLPPDLAAVDIVGTGGDRSGSVNLSTGASLLVAACGVPVIKHGNRSVSSRAGAADVLEALGLPMPLDAAAAGRCFDAIGYTFLFAPYYHPATRSVGPVRAALGVRTVFNILGPLSNPAEPPFHVIGAFSLEVAELVAQTLAGMKLTRAFVIHGAEGWDEPTPVGPFTLFDVTPGSIHRMVRTAQDYGCDSCTTQALAGGDAAYNAAALRAVLRGEQRGAHRDALLMGAALALEVTGVEPTAQAGVARAARAIDSGVAAQLLDKLKRFGEGERQAPPT